MFVLCIMKTVMPFQVWPCAGSVVKGKALPGGTEFRMRLEAKGGVTAQGIPLFLLFLKTQVCLTLHAI